MFLLTHGICHFAHRHFVCDVMIAARIITAICVALKYDIHAYPTAVSM